MAFSTWVHGNAVTVENPYSLSDVGHFGWGGDMLIRPGRASWFHIPLPTPVLVVNTRLRVYRTYLMFRSERCSIRNVHVYDGSVKLQEYNGLRLQGEHRLGMDPANTFRLAAPYRVARGVGISFFVVAEIGFDTPIPDARLIIEGAGADYDT